MLQSHTFIIYIHKGWIEFYSRTICQATMWTSATCDIFPLGPLKTMHWGLGVWFRSLGLEFFLPIMVWGASWDPTGRYSTMEPSVSTFGGSLQLSEVDLVVKNGWNRVKNQFNFFALKISKTCSELMENWGAWKFEFIHAQKLVGNYF